MEIRISQTKNPSHQFILRLSICVGFSNLFKYTLDIRTTFIDFPIFFAQSSEKCVHITI